MSDTSNAADLSTPVFPDAITAYFDETGTHADSKTVAICGFVAPDSVWKALAADWRAALAVRGIACLHAVELPKHDPMFVELARVIARHQPAYFVASIEREKWNEGIKIGSIGAIYTYPYVLLFDLIMKFSLAWSAERVGGAPINLVFAKQKEYRPLAQRVFDAYSAQAGSKSHLGTLAFDTPENLPQLQAADLLAHEITLLFDSVEKTPNAPLREAFSVIVALPSVFYIINNDEIAHLQSVKPQGNALPNWRPIAPRDSAKKKRNAISRDLTARGCNPEKLPQLVDLGWGTSFQFPPGGENRLFVSNLPWSDTLLQLTASIRFDEKYQQAWKQLQDNDKQKFATTFESYDAAARIIVVVTRAPDGSSCPVGVQVVRLHEFDGDTDVLWQSATLLNERAGALFMSMAQHFADKIGRFEFPVQGARGVKMRLLPRNVQAALLTAIADRQAGSGRLVAIEAAKVASAAPKREQ